MRDTEGREGLRGLAQGRPRVAALATSQGGQKSDDQEGSGDLLHQRMNRLRSWSRTRGSELAADLFGIDDDRAAHEAGVERDVLQDGLEHGGETTGPDVLGRLVHLGGHAGQLADRLGGEAQIDPFRGEERLVLAHEGALGLGQDPHEVLFAEGRQLDADGEAALHLGDEVGGLAHVEGAGGDEEDVVGADGAVLGGDRRAFDDGQEVALHSFARDVGTVARFPSRDLVDLVEEHDARGLDALQGGPRDEVPVHEAALLVLPEHLPRLRDGEGAPLGPVPEQARQHVAQVQVHLLDTLIGQDLKARDALLGDLDLHHSRLEEARAELVAELVARGLGSLAGRRDGLGGPVGGGRAGGAGGNKRSSSRSSTFSSTFFADLERALAADHVDGRLHEVADDRVHVAADVPHLGELARLHLDERTAGEAGQAAGDLGLAHPGRADHEDVLGVMSAACSGGSLWRRTRLRSAIATARLAAPWPMTWRSSSLTISRGESASRRRGASLLAGRGIGIG